VGTQLLLGRPTTTTTPRYRLFDTLACPRVGAAPLATYWQTATMPHPAIRANLTEALDIQLNLTAQIAFGRNRRNKIAQRLDLRFRQIFDSDIRANARPREYSLTCRPPNPVDIRERNFDALVAGDVYTFNTRHNFGIPSLVGTLVTRRSVSLDAVCA